MKATANTRLKQFRTTAGLETEDLSEMTGISKSLIEKMEANQMAVSDKTAKILKDKCRVPTEWLMNGIGELKFEFQPVNPYRDYVLKRLEGEVTFLRSMLQSLATGNPNFLRLINNTALAATGSD